MQFFAIISKTINFFFQLLKSWYMFVPEHLPPYLFFNLELLWICKLGIMD